MFDINENDYPKNYDWLTQEQQDNIVAYMNELREQVMWAFKKSRSNKYPDNQHREFYENTYQSLGNREWGAIYAFESIGIKLEYSWAGHNGQYILATYDDAVAENDYYYNIARDTEGDVDLCYIGGDFENE
jgi:hypothetical protein